jgi:hypothetical protein
VSGRFFEIGRDPLREFVQLRERHGAIAYLRIGPQDVALLSQADQIHDGLVTHAAR